MRLTDRAVSVGPRKNFTAEVQRERSRARRILERARADGKLNDAALVLHQQVLDTIEALRNDVVEGRESETALAENFKREV